MAIDILRDREVMGLERLVWLDGLFGWSLVKIYGRRNDEASCLTYRERELPDLGLYGSLSLSLFSIW